MRHTFTKSGFTWESVTVEEVAADPANCFIVTVHGDLPIKWLEIHDGSWVAYEVVNGSTCSGTPKHWHSFIRRTGQEQS